MSEKFLSRKIALVTGSTSGIGLGIAKSLAQTGADIVLNGFGDHEQAVREIQSLGVNAMFHGADMRKPSDIQDMVETVEKTWGKVDILVNNAGIQHVSSIEDFPIDKWDDVIAINLSSSFHTTRSVLPGMREKIGDVY